jgi:hypothetical protein
MKPKTNKKRREDVTGARQDRQPGEGFHTARTADEVVPDVVYRYQMFVMPPKGNHWTDYRIAKYLPRGQKKPQGLRYALVRYSVQSAAAARIMTANPGVAVGIAWPVLGGSDTQSRSRRGGN